MRILHAAILSLLCLNSVYILFMQVRLADTEWSSPIQISKEDTISLVLRRCDGSRRFVKTEIRGYEEGSRFIVVFRLGSTTGPIRYFLMTTGWLLTH